MKYSFEASLLLSVLILTSSFTPFVAAVPHETLTVNNGQTQDPLEIKNSTGSVLASINESGNMTLSTSDYLPDLNIGSGSGLVPASYVVSKLGSQYFAKDGTTGQVVKYGPVAHTVINYAITLINNTNNGGVLYIKNGTYSITSQIQIKGVNNLTICGDGIGATILDASGAPTNVLRQATNGVNNFRLCNLEIDGNDLTLPVYFQGYNQNIYFDNVYVHHATTFVVFFDTVLGTNTNVHLTDSKFAFSGGGNDIVGAGGGDFVVDGSVFINDETRPGEGFAIGDGTHTIVTNSIFNSTGLGFNGNAVHWEGNSTDAIIDGNYFNMYKSAAVDMSGNITRVAVTNNIVDATPAYENGQIGGQFEIDNARHVYVGGNIIEKSSRAGVLAMDVEDFTVAGNTFIDASWANNLRTLGNGTTVQDSAVQIVNYTAGTNMTNNKDISIYGNMFRSIVNNRSGGIIIDNDYQNAQVYGNNLYDVPAANRIVSIGTNVEVLNNQGYTQNNMNGNLDLGSYSLNATHANIDSTLLVGNTAAVGSTGVIRLPNAQNICWRNAANTNDNCIMSSALNRYIFAVGGTTIFSMNSAGAAAIVSGQKFFLDGTAFSGDTYLNEIVANQMELVAGGVRSLSINATGALFHVNSKAGIPTAAELGPTNMCGLWFNTSNGTLATFCNISGVVYRAR